MVSNMARPMVRFHNTEKDEIIDREMNDEEYAEYLSKQKVLAEQEQEKKEKAEKKAQLLAKLGITEDEARLLLS